MMLNPHQERPIHWGAAFALSLVVHGLCFVVLFDLVPTGRQAVPPVLSFPDISVSNVVVEEARPERLDAEPLTALAPAGQSDALDGEIQTNDRIDGTDAQTLEAAGPEPETLLGQDDANRLSALPVERLNPIAPEEGTVLQGATLTQPVVIQAERVAPTQSEAAVPSEMVVLNSGLGASVAEAPRIAPISDLTRVGPSLVAPSDPPPPSDQDEKLLALIDRIRARLDDPCLLALPQLQGAQANPLVVLISDRDRTMAAFTREVLSDPELLVDQRSILVDNRQCPALDFARARSNYPTFKLPLRLQSTVVNSGDELRGTIENTAGFYTSLVLVDDDGVVQDLRRFVRFEGGRAEFNVPVTRDGDARDTSQLLVAVATSSRPATIGSLAGRVAGEFFPALEAEVGTAAVIAVIPFDLR